MKKSVLKTVYLLIVLISSALYVNAISETTYHNLSSKATKANAGGDTIFCGLSGHLNAISSVGVGTWSTNSTYISFEDTSDPNTLVTTTAYNTEEVPYYELFWTEDNTNGSIDSDTIRVTFARIPRSDITIIPPKCFGEPATIYAIEDSLPHYTWNFHSGIIDSAMYNIQGEII